MGRVAVFALVSSLAWTVAGRTPGDIARSLISGALTSEMAGAVSWKTSVCCRPPHIVHCPRRMAGHRAPPSHFALLRCGQKRSSPTKKTAQERGCRKLNSPSSTFLEGRFRCCGFVPRQTPADGRRRHRFNPGLIRTSARASTASSARCIAADLDVRVARRLSPNCNLIYASICRLH